MGKKLFSAAGSFKKLCSNFKCFFFRVTCHHAKSSLIVLSLRSIAKGNYTTLHNCVEIKSKSFINSWEITKIENETKKKSFAKNKN